MCFVEEANETRAANGDVIALLGTAQQELSYRRRYQLQPALPKDMGSICSNVNISITDKLFGDDVEKAIKTARDLQNQECSHGWAAPPLLQTHRTQQVFFRAGIPAVQSAGKLSRPEGERETLEPERDRKVQGEEPVKKTHIPPAARNQSDK